jgi:hypothetical protein
MRSPAIAEPEVVMGLQIPPGDAPTKGKLHYRCKTRGVVSIKLCELDREALKCMAHIMGTRVDHLVRMAVFRLMSSLGNELVSETDAYQLPSLSRAQLDTLREQHLGVQTCRGGQPERN